MYHHLDSQMPDDDRSRAFSNMNKDFAERSVSDDKQRQRVGYSNWVYVDVDKVVKITGKAMLIEVGDERIWLPLTHVDDPDNYAEGDEDLTMAITDWIADKKGLGE